MRKGQSRNRTDKNEQKKEGVGNDALAKTDTLATPSVMVSALSYDDGIIGYFVDQAVFAIYAPRPIA